MITTSTVSKAGAAFVLLSLGSACTLVEGGAGDGGYASDTASPVDGAGPLDAGDASDTGSSTDAAYASPLAVDLGNAGGFAILTKTGITDAPTSSITGNVGVSPGPATYMTGFALILDPTNVFSTSTQVTGKVFASDYASPTPSNLTVAIGDMQTAFADAAGRTPDVVELAAGNLGGMTLSRGGYKWSTGVLIPANLTLAGSGTDVWVFQIAQGLTVGTAASVSMTGGAVPKNVFWEVSGAVDLGTSAHFEGVILAKTAVALHTGASFKGRLLAQTAVTIESSTIVQSAP